MLIDEVHVVDRSFIRRITRMGISRSEPLRGEVSTAGNDPESYGFERQKYGRRVLSGLERNDRMFVAIYEADQKLTDVELAKDPIKYGRLANPAWGHTAYEEEFLDDYKESKRTISGLADFFMYRLNVWQQVANAWLTGADWMACGDPWDIDDYCGYDAYLALDLSKTRDMSAITATVKDGDRLLQTTRLFVTEAYADANQDQANFKGWIHDGHLIEIPGDTIKLSYLKEEFAKFAEACRIRFLVYDKTYADEFTQWVQEEYSDIELAEFPQSYAMMSRPIDDFEAAVIERVIRHDNNPCLNWQAGNCTVKESDRGGRMLVKPKREELKKIDGMVTSVMSAWAATALEESVTPWESWMGVQL